MGDLGRPLWADGAEDPPSPTGAVRRRGSAGGLGASARRRSFEGLDLAADTVRGLCLVVPRDHRRASSSSSGRGGFATGTVAQVLPRRLEQFGLLVEVLPSDACDRVFLRVSAPPAALERLQEKRRRASGLAGLPGGILKMNTQRRKSRGVRWGGLFFSRGEGGAGCRPSQTGDGDDGGPLGAASRWERVTLLHHCFREALQEVSCLPGLHISLPKGGEWEPLHGTDLVEDMGEYGVIQEIFTLHDGEELDWLKRHWIRESGLLRPPIEDLAAYFGPGLAAYFAFLAHYTRWLLAAALAAAWTLAVRWLIAGSSVSGAEVCSALWGGSAGGAGSLAGVRRLLVTGTAVPLCVVKLALPDVQDVELPSVVLGLFLAFWSSAMLRTWARKERELAPLRSEEADAPPPALKVRSEWLHQGRVVLGNLGVFAFVVLVQVPVCVSFVWVESSVLRHRAGALWAALGVLLAGLQVLVATVFNKFAGRLARWMNRKGIRGRLESEEDSTIYKTFAFFAVNSYTILFWYAFWVRDVDVLRTQLQNRFIVMQVVQNAIELGGPFLTRALRARRSPAKLSAVEEEFLRPAYTSGTSSLDGKYEDLLELAVQWGMLVMFSPVYPAAPLFALLNNAFELRSDATKLCYGLRSPRPDDGRSCHTPSIGVWFRIFEGLSWLAVVTNAAIFAFVWQQPDKGAGGGRGDCRSMSEFLMLEHYMALLVFLPKLCIPKKSPPAPGFAGE